MAKFTKRIEKRPAGLLQLALVNFLFSLALFAQPMGPEVVHGEAAFTYPTNDKMEVWTGDRTIINWDSFSIEGNETTKFIQPGGNSAVLNRVTSGEVSHILGTLEGNGNVFLINPNGIVFGAGAEVNTNAFVASTLDVLDSSFIGGRELLFQGDSCATIVNLGTIQSRDGDVALIGRMIENRGMVRSPKGTVTLAAGREVLLKPEGSQRVYISALSEEVMTEGTGIDNKGAIEALRIHLFAKGNPYKLAINHEGRIDALTVEERGGEIYLLSEGGSVGVRGTIIGNQNGVRILGKEIDLFEGTHIDTSTAHHPGTILIGGSFQGEDRSILHAERTTVHPGAFIRSSSIIDGEGGLVVLWSDVATTFRGTIEVSGGKHGGNGGLIEISSKGFLDVEGGEPLRPAPAGTPGKLLLDPSHVVITDGLNNKSLFSHREFSPTGPVSSITVKSLTHQLNYGPVEVTTTSGFGGNGDIVIATDMDEYVGFNTPHTLTLTSDRDLIVQGSVQNSGDGTIDCNVGRDLKVDGGANIARIGSRFGKTKITTGRHLLVAGGEKGQGHIGYDAAVSNGKIHLSVGGDLVVQGEENFALIGFTNTSTYAPQPTEGHITIDHVGGDLIVSSNGKENSFAQIGLAIDQKNSDRSQEGFLSGDISIKGVEGELKVLSQGGEKGTYALIGHGGQARSFEDTYSGSIEVEAKGPITIIGGQSEAPEKFAGIGFGQEFATPNITHTFSSDLVSVTSGGDITIEGGKGDNPAFIGTFTGNNNDRTTAAGKLEKVFIKTEGVLKVLEDGVIGIGGVGGSISSNIEIMTKDPIEGAFHYINNGGGDVVFETIPPPPPPPKEETPLPTIQIFIGDGEILSPTYFNGEIHIHPDINVTIDSEGALSFASPPPYVEAPPPLSEKIPIEVEKKVIAIASIPKSEIAEVVCPPAGDLQSLPKGTVTPNSELQQPETKTQKRLRSPNLSDQANFAGILCPPEVPTPLVIGFKTVERSQLLVSELLTNLHPMDEALGWPLEFYTKYGDHKQPYYLRTKKLSFHFPKSES